MSCRLCLGSGQPLPIRAESDGEDRAAVTFQDACDLAGQQIPDLHRAVLVPRRNPPAIRSERGTMNAISRSLEGLRVLACRRIPEPNSQIEARRGEPLPIRTERDTGPASCIRAATVAIVRRLVSRSRLRRDNLRKSPLIDSLRDHSDWYIVLDGIAHCIVAGNCLCGTALDPIGASTLKVIGITETIPAICKQCQDTSSGFSRGRR